jgi:hypothetical protein
MGYHRAAGDKDRIFTNVYGFQAVAEGAQQRGDWDDTKA